MSTLQQQQHSYKLTARTVTQVTQVTTLTHHDAHGGRHKEIRTYAPGRVIQSVGGRKE
jgi:hypothetical protein